MTHMLAFGPDLMAELDELSKLTDGAEGELTRLYLSDAHVKAIRHVQGLMEQAGMEARIDPLGNVVGRYPGKHNDAPAIMLGSHIDTVRNGGKYDGNLGVLAAIAAVSHLHKTGERLSYPIEIIAFGEEEGVRFPTKLLTSRAVAGLVESHEFDVCDAQGMSVRDALRHIGGDADRFRECARQPGSLAAYIELHIEQGPVLEAENRAIGLVTAINGYSRLQLDISGMAGHAGTVPMDVRHDALCAAAEMVLDIEAIARSTPRLVATVGQLQALPGAINVIPGDVRMTLDIRHANDDVRMEARKKILKSCHDRAKARGVDFTTQLFAEHPATAMDNGVLANLELAVMKTGQNIRKMESGAGHDAMAMAKLCPAAMIFLRCKGGVSHNPLESILVEDADLAVRVLIEALRSYQQQNGG